MGHHKVHKAQLILLFTYTDANLDLNKYLSSDIPFLINYLKNNFHLLLTIFFLFRKDPYLRFSTDHEWIFSEAYLMRSAHRRCHTVGQTEMVRGLSVPLPRHIQPNWETFCR